MIMQKGISRMNKKEYLTTQKVSNYIFVKNIGHYGTSL